MELTTLKPETREQWLEARQSILTASDCAAVLGFDPYRSAREVYVEKRGLLDKPFDETRFTRAGQKLEPVVLDFYREETGFDVEPNGLLIELHPKYSWLGATRDATATTPHSDRRNVEAKSTGFYPGQRWGQQGTDEVPERVLTQTQIQMSCSNLELTDVPVLIGGNDFRIYHVEYSPRFVELAIERLEEFWEMVQSGTPPALDAEKDAELVKRMYRKVESETKKLPADLLDTVRKLARARNAKAEAEKAEKHAKALLLDAIGNAEVGAFDKSDIRLVRKLVVKNFKPQVARTSEEIHLKIEGDLPE